MYPEGTPEPNTLGAEMAGKPEYMLQKELLDDGTRPTQEKFVK